MCITVHNFLGWILAFLACETVINSPFIFLTLIKLYIMDWTSDVSSFQKNACRVAASNWNGEGSFLFTSSTALYDCSDNMMCNEVLEIDLYSAGIIFVCTFLWLFRIMQVWQI